MKNQERLKLTIKLLKRAKHWDDAARQRTDDPLSQSTATARYLGMAQGLRQAVNILEGDPA